MGPYVQMQGPNEFLYIGNLKDWNRIAEMHRIAVPCAGHRAASIDEMTPACALRMQQACPMRRSPCCGTCSHMPMYEDPETYFGLLTKFLGQHRRKKSAARRRG